VFFSSVSLLSLAVYVGLLVIACYATYQAYLQSEQFMLSESGLIEEVAEHQRYYGKISHHSFYNGFFIFLILDINENVFINKSNKRYITLYADAITESEYRLLARLINNGRH